MNTRTPPPPATKSILALLISLLALLAIRCAPHTVGDDPVTRDEMARNFATPPDSVKPWVYWYWISDNISKEGITRDLEAMARVGIGEALIGNIGLDNIPYGKVPVLSEEWWQLVEHAIREGKRVGVDIGMFNCPGWSQSGGPWVTAGEAMRYIAYSETTFTGDRKISARLSTPHKLFQDVTVLAYPVPEADSLRVVVERPHIATVGKAAVVDVELQTPLTARSIALRPDSTPFAANVDVQVAENGRFITVKSFRFDRSNPSVSVGPIPFGDVEVSLPEITAKRFRLVMTDISSAPDKQLHDGNIAAIVISTAPRLERYIEKQLGKMHQTPFPLWSEYQWPTQAEEGSRGMAVEPGAVLNISSALSSNGLLTWEAPPGKWIVMRIGMTPTGTKNSPAAPHGQGYEVDKMNRDHLRKHFDAFMGVLLKRMPPEDRTALKHVVLDSYEQGSENWTEGFAQDFRNRYGYDPLPWLPVFSGRIVGSANQSNRFLWDLRRLVADRIAYDYVGGLRDVSQHHGLRVWLENFGHWGFPSEFLMYGGQSHDIGGEFWAEGQLGNIECRAASSAAHTYGKRRVSAESYTAAGRLFRRTPHELKRRGDWSYTEGINHVALHVYIHQPYEDRTPGMNAWFGTEFNRKNTWFEQSKKWIDYQRRCMYMLQRGRIVNDVCYFIGEDTPKMTGVRTPEIPRGYSFDYINAEVILNRLSVDNGQLMLPDGVRYRLMVLPPITTMRPTLLLKIKQLVADGATILGNPPDRSPSLQSYPDDDRKVKALAAELWGNATGSADSVREFKKGRVLRGVSLQSALARVGAAPDVSIPDTSRVLWIHRKTIDSDIYFVTNQADQRLTADFPFRVRGRKPELWDAITGKIRPLLAYSQRGEHTSVPLTLDAGASAFIVFTGDGEAGSGTLEDNFPPMQTLLSVTSPWTVRFDTAMGGPAEPVTLTVPGNLVENKDPRIKYYSGTAIYSTEFDCPAPPNGVATYLDLGKVSAMAEVRVNGRSAGGVWTTPWQVDITGLIAAGRNRIEVEMVNSWVNRLIGENRLPLSERKTWTATPAVKPDDPLEPSGLLGNVKIVVGRQW